VEVTPVGSGPLSRTTLLANRQGVETDSAVAHACMWTGADSSPAARLRQVLAVHDFERGIHIRAIGIEDQIHSRRQPGGGH